MDLQFELDDDIYSRLYNSTSIQNFTHLDYRISCKRYKHTKFVWKIEESTIDQWNPHVSEQFQLN